MRYMEFENGVENGKRAVEINAEFNWTLNDYKKNLQQELREYKEGANAAEIRTYSAGYMRGVEDALAALSEDCVHPDSPVSGCEQI